MAQKEGRVQRTKTQGVEKVNANYALLCLLVLLVSCAQERATVQDSEILQPQDTALNYPPGDEDRFKEVQREIDYWYNKPARSIGTQHKTEMMNRLLALSIRQELKEEYVQKLDSILLADDPAYLEQQRTQREAEQAQPQDQQRVKNCEGEGTVQFTSAPIPLESLGFIIPLGALTGHHVTPTDHGYMNANTWTNLGDRREENLEKFADVLAPAAGMISEVNSMPSEFATSTIGDYHITIYYTCTFYTVFIHVNQISEKLKTVLETRVPATVEAGEVIGRSPAFDFAVYNE
ncbi:MAG: hypothetical protein Q7S65_02820, partial [Nanoarchaeota archaeon]|nr:hypothetical protein [Nanoarchaeota archaeon]